MSRLLVLEPAEADGNSLVAAATGLGHEVFGVYHGREGRPHTSELAGHVFVDLSSGSSAVDDIVAFAASRHIDGVTTAREFLTPMVARVCAKLDLPGNDPALADAPRNKFVMGECFDRSGVSIPWTAVADSATEIEAMLRQERLRLPIVVKPTESAGSVGVSVVRTASEVAAAFALARAHANRPYGMRLDQRVIVQEYIGGQEYSVESVTQDGRVHHVCITRKVTTGGAFRVEIGHSLPTELDGVVADGVLREASKAVRAVGLRNGISHTEVMVRPDGRCAVIEIAARMGHGRIGKLVEFALGIPLNDAIVQVALGQPAALTERRHRHAASRLPLPPTAGRVLAVENMPAVGDDVVLSELEVEIGESVTGPENNRGRVGVFVVCGDDEAEVGRRADELLENVVVTVKAENAHEGA